MKGVNVKMTKVEKSYSIGLDIGTSSVGWALVDNDYSLLKHKGKNTWGARLFEEGKTAVGRRVARSTRRRIHRRKERIALLKELVAPMVLDEDPNFFMRMEKGYQTKKDKGYDYNLFIEEGFQDTDYYKRFKTMYHLRKYLCETKEKVDPRLVYLALHHIVKYRGNFLYEGQKFEINDSSEVENDLEMALAALVEEHEIAIDINTDFVSKLLKILMDTSIKRGVKKDQCMSEFTSLDKTAKSMAKEVVSLLVGYESNLTKLFPSANIQKDGKDFKTNFSSTKYDDDIDFIESSLPEHFEFLAAFHKVYSFLLLQDVMNAKNTISEAMIEKYETHEKDLKELKHFVKEYYTLQDYNDIFRRKAMTGNYYSYINEPRKTSKKELYDFIKKKLASNEQAIQTETYHAILDRIEAEHYLPKQTSKDNGAIPYQLHEMELVKILDNQAAFYAALFQNKDKILSLFTFRVPYYVGPLNDRSEFHWFERKTAGKIKPWNIDEKIDMIASAEKFIRKMTNMCTYLYTEPVVPKKSLLYSRYEVLNELNKIQVNKKKIEVDVKKEILNEVFMRKKKITEDDIKNFFMRKQYCNVDDTITVEGMQKEKEFATSLEPWIDFKGIYGDDFASHYDEIEQLIEWISVYEDKKILKKRIKNEYPEMEDSKLNKILKKRYKGWGRFSRKLLTELERPDQNGIMVSIMDCLEDTQMNFMQIINEKKLGFAKMIDDTNSLEEKEGKITYDDIAKLQGSPAIKKGIWQTTKIVAELVKFMGHAPQNIFIEFARSDEDKVRTLSKVKRLQDIYNEIKKNHEANEDTMRVLAHLSKEDKNAKLDNERLYLYYIQQGKCMYSGKALDISLLSSYQVDHIIPQSYIKDDSIENKVLVYANENQYKGDKLLLSRDVICQRHGWWKHLHTYHLIGDKKFKNLTRANLSQMEEINFINRQLVETRQITKHVANLLKNVYQDSNIVSIKAGLSHEFREKFDLYKLREVNDYHHAQDAYIATILGTYVMRKYPVLKKEFIFTEYNQIKKFKKELETMNVKQNKFGFILNQLGNKDIFDSETGELLWNGSKSIEKIKSTFSYKDCFITKKVEEKKGQLFNLTINKVADIQSTIDKDPHKVIPVNKNRSDISQYGGFTNLEYAYGIAVAYPYKKRMKRVILNVPRFLADGSKEALIAYLKAETKSEEVTIIKDKILFNQLMEIDGGLYFMASATEWNNARQLVLSAQSHKTLYRLFNGRKPTEEELMAVYDEYVDKLGKYYPSYKGLQEKFIKQRDNLVNESDKAPLFKEMLKITKANPINGNIVSKSLNISARAGRIMNKTIYLEDTVFIDQSITGLFTKKFKL